MNVAVFQTRAEVLICAMERLTAASMVRKGDKAEDCQRTTLENRIRSLRFVVNGVEEADMRPEIPELSESEKVDEWFDKADRMT